MQNRQQEFKPNAFHELKLQNGNICFYEGNQSHWTALCWLKQLISLNIAYYISLADVRTYTFVLSRVLVKRYLQFYSYDCRPYSEIYTGKLLTFMFAVLSECHSIGRVDLYFIVKRKLKSYVKDFSLRVTMYYLHNIY